MIRNKDFKNFLTASRKLGENFYLTQGAGGNTSFKDGDYLYIKASGFKLKDAEKDNIFVKVEYKKILTNISNRKTNPIDNTWDKSKKLKPSIETTMHSIMPHKYVFHLHCLNTISVVVQKNFRDELHENFKNENYSVIDYAMPGEALTKKIKENLDRVSPDILFLSNHGLVVGSNCLNEALEQINYVSNKIKKFYNKEFVSNTKKLEEFSEDSLFRPTKNYQANILGSSHEYIKFVTSGVLFPDQAVFIGPRIIVVENKKDIREIEKRYRLQKNLPILIVPKSGILVPKNISNESEELVLALSIIIAKLPKGAIVNYLNESQVNQIINSNAEKYRLSINTPK